MTEGVSEGPVSGDYVDDVFSRRWKSLVGGKPSRWKYGPERVGPVDCFYATKLNYTITFVTFFLDDNCPSSSGVKDRTQKDIPGSDEVFHGDLFSSTKKYTSVGIGRTCFHYRTTGRSYVKKEYYRCATNIRCN